MNMVMNIGVLENFQRCQNIVIESNQLINFLDIYQKLLYNNQQIGDITWIMRKKEICESINKINDMIDFIICDDKTVCLGREGKLLRNGALFVFRDEHQSTRCIDSETIISDYINYLFGKDNGGLNYFGVGGKYGHYIDYIIYDKDEIVYNVQVNVEPNCMYMSPGSRMKPIDIDLNSEWYRILYEEYCEEKEKRKQKILKKK